MSLERYAYNIYGTFSPVFKHSGDWEISRKLCKPSTACRLYITFSKIEKKEEEKSTSFKKEIRGFKIQQP